MAILSENELENLRPVINEEFVKLLAAFKYPGYTHVKASELKNPVEVLVSALGADNLEARLIEALPWLLLTALAKSGTNRIDY